MVYRPQIGELQINACSPQEKELYRTMLGKHLFGSEEMFPGADKYTLAPLRADGAASLACDDVEGIEWVRLREVQFFFGGNRWELVTHKADDFFELLASREAPFPEGGRLVRATFHVKFQGPGSRKPRTVVVKPSNVAQFTRDDDSVLVERWLVARGFVLGNRTDGDKRV
jgi:hypothetical protein